MLAVVDSECIGPGMPRIAIAGAAVYAAHWLTDGKSVTQADVLEAASTVVSTYRHQVITDSRKIHEKALSVFRGGHHSSPAVPPSTPSSLTPFTVHEATTLIAYSGSSWSREL